MTIEQMRQRKQEKGYTYAQIAELSGVPLGTVQKIFSGETTNPRYDTLQALENLFSQRPVLAEESLYTIHQQGSYTLEDYYALPDDRRVELIDGYFYDMASPTFLHQRIAGEIYRQIANYIMEHDGNCQPLLSPIDIQLDCDTRTMVQPDIAILCHNDRVRHWGIYGAPDFILEVISPSTRKMDYTKKLAKYEAAGVREYWILDPYQKRLLVYFFENESYPFICGLDAPVPVNIYDGALKIQFEHILNWIEHEVMVE